MLKLHSVLLGFASHLLCVICRLPKQLQSGYRPQEVSKGDAVLVVPVRRQDSVAADSEGAGGDDDTKHDAERAAADAAEELKRSQEEVAPCQAFSTEWIPSRSRTC